MALKAVLARVRAAARPGPTEANPRAGEHRETEHSGVVARVQTTRWLDPRRLQVTGWVYAAGVSATPVSRPALQVWLEAPTGERVVARTARHQDHVINLVADDPAHDYSGSGFSAVLDLGAPPVRGARWTLRFRLSSGGLERTGGFGSRAVSASAGSPVASGAVDGRTFRPRWSARTGLLVVEREARYVLETARVDGHRVELTVETGGEAASRAVLVRHGEDGQPVEHPVEVHPTGPSTAAVALEVPRGDAAWHVRIYDDRGEQHDLWWQPETRGAVHAAATPVRVVNAPAGTVRIDTAPAVLVDAVDASGEGLGLSGRACGVEPVRTTFELRGRGDTFPATDVRWSGEEFRLAVPDSVCHWGASGTTLPSGAYALWAVTAAGEQREVELTPGAVTSLPRVAVTDAVRLRLARSGQDAVRVVAAAPRRDDERGAFARRSLRDLHERADAEPEHAVYFESFYGRAATDSPRAMDDELVRRGSGLTRYWGVADLSVQVPDGATPLLIGSRAWWEVVERVAYYVTNAGTTGMLRDRAHRTVVQTWHGTPLKLLGADRLQAPPEPTGKPGRANTAWDYLLAGNPHSADVFARAYAYDGPILDLGYPRNDVLATSTEALRSRTRRLLGAGPETVVVLYAPTWREGQSQMVDLLDYSELHATLGDDYVLLVRGHTNTLKQGGAARGPQVVDVTTYPEINDLFAAADVMVTDYSSVMFDYSVTGKPMLFLVPDLADYRERRRGMYFDLGDVAPGPLVETTAQVAKALLDRDRLREEYADRYAAWRERFNPRDDGLAARRVVDEIFG